MGGVGDTDAVDNSGQRRHARARGLQPVTFVEVIRQAERGAQPGEGGVLRTGRHPGRDDRTAVLPGEVSEVQPQVVQEDLPAAGQAVVLRVPVGARAETADHEPHDAAAAVARLDEPLMGQRPVAVTFEDHPARRLPGGDGCRDLADAGAEVHPHRSAFASFDLVRDEPRCDARPGGDRLPYLLRGPGDLDGQIDDAFGFSHCLDSFPAGRGWLMAIMRYQRPPSADSS